MLIDPTDSWVRSAFVPVFPVYWSSTTRGILSWTNGYATAVIYSLRPTRNVHLRFKICSPCCNLLPPSHKKCSSKIQNLSPKKVSISLSNIQLSPSLSSSTYHRFLCTKWIFFCGTDEVLSYITTVLKIVTRVNQKRKEYTPSVLKYNVL